MSTPADQESAVPAVDPVLDRARRALAWRLGGIVNKLADRDDVLLDMTWAPEQEKIAWFVPALARVTINGSIALEQGVHPDQVDPLIESGRLRHPVVVGLCGHEAAHARCTRWADWEPGAGRAAVRAAVMLEEPRIEGRHLAQRPGDRVFLRASAANIVLPRSKDASQLADRWAAATASALVLARVDAGVLTDKEAAPVRALINQSLGRGDATRLRNLGRKALALADGDQAGLLELARRWVEIIGADQDEDLPGTGCAAGDPDNPEPSGPGSPGPGGTTAGSDPLREALTRLTESVSVDARIETGALPDPADVARQQQAAARQARERAAESAARDLARDSARSVFAAPTEARQAPTSPVVGERAPTSAERAGARRLGEALLRAQFRAPVHVNRRSALPPGRLMGREAMFGAAQRALGMPVTARPYRHRVRQVSTEPPVVVGVAVDVSGSMKPYTEQIASVAWMFAHAARETGGRAATVAFGTAVTPIVSPDRPPATVTRFLANDGNHRFTQAAAALDGGLGLATGSGARILVIVSDGFWEPSELASGEQLVKRLVRSGAEVVWICLNPSTDVLPGARRLDVTSVAEIPAALGAVLVSALRRV
ncbi:VWA domain-containing protein [Streptacidiphilus sp. EB103A]|uniref:VWA domain-containing protein n=1 Tax=Streptacidiphilus sp. EB103A TaxID=3156275 RepID=UPI0035130769